MALTRPLDRAFIKNLVTKYTRRRVFFRVNYPGVNIVARYARVLRESREERGSEEKLHQLGYYAWCGSHA